MVTELDPGTVRSVVAHMNDDHADALLACAQAFTPHRNASAVQMTDIDAHGIALDCIVGRDTLPAVIRFDRPLAAADDIRPVLVAMTRVARARLSEPGRGGTP